MAPQVGQQAWEKPAKLFAAAGRLVCDASTANIYGAHGSNIHEYPRHGYRLADHLSYSDGKIAGVIEAQFPGGLPHE